MDKQELIDKIKNELQPYLENQGIELVDISSHYEYSRMVLRALLDYPEGGISLDKCARLNNEISNLLDSKELINESYVLEVSSPGIDRPLKVKADFIRAKNRNVRFFLSQPLNGKREISGVIEDVDDEFIYLSSGNNQIKIPFVKIISAKQVV